MKHPERAITILVADDDEDDCLLLREAFTENRFHNDLRFVADGEELMDYLYRRNQYLDPAASPRPQIVLLDLNMPRKDGREALREIKSHPKLRVIPVVIVSTSKEEHDILHSYDLGASSFIVKPETFERLTQVVKSLGEYWLRIVALPPSEEGG